MRIYFLVEGRRTESKVYEAWLSYLIPELSKLRRYNELRANSYFLLNAQGYPSIIYDLIPSSIEDINRVGGYNYFVVCLDADEGSVRDRVDEINDFLSRERIYLALANMIVIVQNRCIETWFLGNRRIIRRNPSGPRLQEYLRHYDVRLHDPELMPKASDFNTHSEFHFQYLKEVFRERNIHYSKRRPGHTLTKPFLNQLIIRVEGHSDHLMSFQLFLNFCAQVKAEIASGI